MSLQPEKLKGVSIRQPWTEMILQGIKTVEYLGLPTMLLGKIYIYAELELGKPIASLPTGTVEITVWHRSDGEFEWHLETPQRLLPVEQIPSTPCHAKYLPHDLTKYCASGALEKLTSVLSNAQVDLNTHQVEAALFAFSNTLSNGAIRGDEVD